MRIINLFQLQIITNIKLYEPVLKNIWIITSQGVIIRPATVCGYSEKMRFDLTVNILTNYAYNKGFIRVFGGQQS